MGLFRNAPHKDPVPPYILFGGRWFTPVDLMLEHWMGFASIAWARYNDVGRGCLWLPTELDAAENGPPYIAAARPSLLEDRSQFAQRLRIDLARYTPDREFVLVFSAAKDEKSYRAGSVEDYEGVFRPPTPDFPTPPVAYQRVAETIT